MLSVARVAVEHGSHFPLIGPGIVGVLVALPVLGGWLCTRGVRRINALYDAADVNGERDGE